MARRRVARNLLRWACSALVAAGLAHGVVWLDAVRRLDALVGEQAQALRAQGWRVVLGPARPQGWPGRAGLQFGPASVEADGFAWRAEGAAIDVPLRWPESVSGAITGPARVRAEGQQIRFGSGPALALVSRDLQLDASGDAATLAGTAVGVARLFEAEALQMRLGPEGLALSARRVKLPGFAQTRGEMIDLMALHATTPPPLPIAKNPRDAATAWRDAGGAVHLSDITLTMGSARAVGQGRIGLDDALQPTLDGTVRVTGYAAGLDELAAAGVLTRQTAVAAKTVLGLLAAATPDGSAVVPVQIAGGVLTVARFPLLRVPALDWPDGR